MKRKLIQWPEAKYWDKPWNPIIGCRPCSPACEHCYAKRIVERFNTTGICAPGFAPTETGRVNPPRKGVVFCGNMTDLFGEWVPIQKQFSFFSALWHFPEPHSGPRPNEAVYLFLTKRTERMCKALSNYTEIPHAYFGFTAENQEWYERRWHEVSSMMPKRANLWLSAEPLLGPIDMADTPPEFKWVVVGCESGPGRRPCKMEWVESIVEQCLDYGVPVFVKQLDIGGKCVTDIDQFPKHLRIRQVPWKKEDEE